MRMVARFSGFGTFGKNAPSNVTNKFHDEIEEIAEDLESQHVKEIMGISEFGKKAKSFDISVSDLTAAAPFAFVAYSRVHFAGTN